jgi:hypothetical protein
MRNKTRRAERLKRASNNVMGDDSSELIADRDRDGRLRPLAPDCSAWSLPNPRTDRSRT